MSAQVVDSKTDSQGNIEWVVNTSYPITQRVMTSSQIGKHTVQAYSFHVTLENESVVQIAKLYGVDAGEVLCVVNVQRRRVCVPGEVSSCIGGVVNVQRRRLCVPEEVSCCVGVQIIGSVALCICLAESMHGNSWQIVKLNSALVDISKRSRFHAGTILFLPVGSFPV